MLTDCREAKRHRPRGTRLDLAAVAEVFDFVRLIRNDENLGFGIASNQGVAASTSPPHSATIVKTTSGLP